MFERDDKLIKEVALRLQQARKQTGLSIGQMASHLGLTLGGYTKNERGENFPGLPTLKFLSRDFDISMDWLIFNKEPMHYKKKKKREQELEQPVEKLTQTVAALESELNKVKNELDEERKKQAKAAEERAAAIEMRPEVRELLDYMTQDQVFYHRLMLNFQEFIQQKKEIGDIDIAGTSTPQLPDQS